MFNIAFPELIVIGVVALIVLGPDKLPKVARAAGLVFGRVQRFTMNIKSELDKELHTQDLQRLEAELRNHDLGLNEELRQGMKPVAEVIQQNREPREAALQAADTAEQSVSSLQAVDDANDLDELQLLKRSASK